MKTKGKHVRSRYLLVVLTIVCVVMITLTAGEVITIAPVRNAVSTVFVPLQTGINKVGDWLNGQRVGQKNVRELAEENAELKEKVAALEEQNTILEENTKELSSLRELYELDSDYSEYEKVAASVISKDPGNWYHSFTINKGSNSGIEVDMNVIADGGLVGIVTEVGTNWAKVRSIIDDDNNISAMLLESSANCIITGDLSLLEEGKMRLTDLSVDAEVTTGERVITSNISDKYLPGILIGYVDSLEADTNGLTQNGYILPVVDFDNIDEVLVIKKLKTTADSSEETTDNPENGEAE